MGKKDVVLLILSFVLGIGSLAASFVFAQQYLWTRGLHWYPFILITPPLCFAISYVLMILERTKITRLIGAFLSLCGDYSFELYLIHIPVFAVLPDVISKLNLSSVSTWGWAMGVVCVGFACFGLRRLTKLCLRLCGKLRKV